MSYIGPTFVSDSERGGLIPQEDVNPGRTTVASRISGVFHRIVPRALEEGSRASEASRPFVRSVSGFMPSASPDHRSSVSSITPSVSITPPVSITTPHGSFAQRPLPPTPPPRRDSEISIQEIPEEDSGGDSEEIYVNPNAFFKAPAGSPAWQEEKSRRRTSLGFQSSFELYKATQAQIKRAAGFTSLSGAPIRYAWNASHSSEDYVDLSSVKREITLATTHEEDVQQMEFSEDAIMHSKGEDA